MNYTFLAIPEYWRKIIIITIFKLFRPSIFFDCFPRKIAVYENIRWIVLYVTKQTLLY